MHWNANQRQLEASLTNDVRPLLEHLAQQGQITIKQQATDKQLETFGINGPIAHREAGGRPVRAC